MESNFHYDPVEIFSAITVVLNHRLSPEYSSMEVAEMAGDVLHELKRQE